MFKRTITILTLISFIVYLYGCSSSLEITNEQVGDYPDYEIKSIVTTEDVGYKFEYSDLYPSPEIKDSILVGWVKTPFEKNAYTIKEIKVPISKIKTLSIEKFDRNNTCIISFVAFAFIGLMWLLSVVFSFQFNNQK